MKAELGTYPKNRQILHKILPIDTPLEIDFHISGVCNFKCNYCIWSLPKDKLKDQVLMAADYMSMDTFEKALDQLKEFPDKIKHITLTGGEPLLHKDLPKMIKMISDADVTNTIQVITNGTLLTRELSQSLIDSGLTELKISLQGLNEEAYWNTSLARINWQNFYDNIKYFSEIKGNCKLKVKIADIALNVGEDKKFFELFGDICDAVAIEHIYDAWAVNGMEYENFKGNRKTRYGHQVSELEVCKCVFCYLDILPDGMIATRCHRDLGWGNIHNKTLFESWNSVNINNMRKGFLDGTLRHPKCTINTQTVHPEDILDGYEDEILERMKQKGMLDES